MPTLGVCCFSSCRLLIGPSTSVWVFLWGGIRRFEYLEQTLQCCHRLCAAHDRTMTLSRFFIRKVFIGFMCAFSRMLTFLMWSFLVFPCIHLTIFISVDSHFLIAQHSPPYVIEGLIAVLYILFFNTSGTILSQMTPDISRHLLYSITRIFRVEEIFAIFANLDFARKFPPAK